MALTPGAYLFRAPGAPAFVKRGSGAVDPSTGLLLASGCRPKHGQAVRELFISGSEPLSVCPRGAADAHPDTLATVSRWSKDKFTRGRQWVKNHLSVDRLIH